MAVQRKLERGQAGRGRHGARLLPQRRVGMGGCAPLACPSQRTRIAPGPSSRPNRRGTVARLCEPKYNGARCVSSHGSDSDVARQRLGRRDHSAICADGGARLRARRTTRPAPLRGPGPGSPPAGRHPSPQPDRPPAAGSHAALRRATGDARGLRASSIMLTCSAGQRRRQRGAAAASAGLQGRAGPVCP
jgi:hypothetical protein